MSIKIEPDHPEFRPKIWRNVLFVIGTAAFGGLAVALWNRRELAHFQKERSRQSSEPIPPGDPEEEII